MRRPSMLVCVRAAVLALPVFLACASQSNSNGTGNGAAGNNGTGGTGGSNGGGSNGGGTNGGTGGSGNNGSGGSTANGGSTGGSGNNGGSNGGGTTADGGSTSTAPDSGKRVCAVANADVIADFEDDTLTMVAQNGYTGIWYDFADTTGGANNPSILVQETTDPMPVEDGGVCNKYSMHTTGGLGTSGTSGYAGTRGDFLAHQIPAGSTTANTFPPPYSIPSTFDGIQFDVMVGSGGATSLTFEVVTQDTQPVPSGGNVPDASTAALFNNRGWMLLDNPSATQTNGTPINTTWQTVYIPFALLIPDYPPSGCATGVFCQAPPFDPTQALGIQFVENPGESPGASFDLWIDNVAFYSGTQGLTPPSMPNNISPTFADGALGSCTKPTGATGKDLEWAYRNWYSRFVVQVNQGSNSELKIIRPEDNNDTVSEGIGYGMLIAVAMGDQTLFDGLWQYWQDNVTVPNENGSAGGLMTWNNTGGSGSATDADQDAAFALLQAGAKFGNSSINYTASGQGMVATIWDHEIDPNSFLPTGGSNYTTTGAPSGTPTTSGKVTDPSYFAPGYYPTFKANDPQGHAWGTVQTNVYAALENIEKASDGLVPAWCSSTSDTATSGFCTSPAENTSSTDITFQYDAHRVAWRVGLDSCWNGTASAQSVLSSIVDFFNGIAEQTASTGGGIGRVMDLYTITGTSTPTPASGAQPNSMSLIGCTGVGAMANGTSSFANSAWQFVLDMSNRGTLDVATTGTNSGYSYFNATVGLLTLLSMSGNIVPP